MFPSLSLYIYLYNLISFASKPYTWEVPRRGLPYAGDLSDDTATMAVALLSGVLTEILIPVAAVIGIAFALFQWVLVSKVKLSPEPRNPGPGSGGDKNGFSDYLIEEEEGLNEHSVVTKCAEIQNAISEGEDFLSRSEGFCFVLFEILACFEEILLSFCFF